MPPPPRKSEPFMPPTKKELSDPIRGVFKEALHRGGHTEWRKKLDQEDKVKDFKAGLTPEALSKARGSLKKVTTANVPWARNLEIARGGDHATHTGAEFADFVSQTRRDLTTLASTDSGRDLFLSIDSARKRKVTIQDAGSAPGIREGSRPHDGEASQEKPDLLGLPGDGSDATVRHHTDITQRWGHPMPSIGQSPKQLEQVGMSSALALGHELIHAAHAVHGVRKRPDSTATVKPEERSTVGHVDGRRGAYGMPTENSMRKDMTRQV